MQKKSASWVAITLWLIFFFPVGIFLIIKKVTNEKFSYIKNGKALKNLGIVLMCFGAIYLIMSITDDVAMLTAFFIFGGLGVLSFVKGNQYIKKGNKYNRYVSIINANNTLIDNIAAAYPTSFEQATEDIQSMLDDGYFMNSYIDLNRRELIMPQRSVSVNVTVNQNTTRTETQPTSVKCKNCGATNMLVPSTVNECEYCGSPL